MKNDTLRIDWRQSLQKIFQRRRLEREKEEAMGLFPYQKVIVNEPYVLFPRRRESIHLDSRLRGSDNLGFNL